MSFETTQISYRKTRGLSAGSRENGVLLDITNVEAQAGIGCGIDRSSEFQPELFLNRPNYAVFGLAPPEGRFEVNV